VKSSVEALEGNKVRVVVDAEESELEPALDDVWRQIAKEVRLPGFRPGKAPRRLLQQHVDPGYARAEALRTAMPELYVKAVIEHDVDVIESPDLEITAGEESGDITFEAVVEVRPMVTVAGYSGLRVELPSPAVPDEDVEAEIDRFRGRFGELAGVERPAAEGDYVVIDLDGTREGEPVEGLSAEGYSYLVGSGMIASEFDEHLRGAAAGDTVDFDAEHPDPDEDPVHFSVTVHEVQERVLPELTDEWVADATEFSTVEEFRASVAEELTSSREAMVRQSVRPRVGAELAKLVEDDIPEALVRSEFQSRLQAMASQLGNSGIKLEDYLRIIGQDPETFTTELNAAAAEGVRIDLALRAVAAAEGLDATDEEVEDEVVRMIGSAPMSLEEGLAQLRDGGQLSAVRSEIATRKALEWLVERTEIVDPDGGAIPSELLAAPPEHDHDHDHDDHDHDHDH
jgi:trigger factor